MSMIGNFLRVPPATLEELRSDPERITDVLYPDEDDEPDRDGERDDAMQLDVDKAWHGIHFLLTGSAWEGDPPLHFIVAGGESIGEIDVGYGPARGFSADEVRAIATALAPITADTLRARFDAAALAKHDIYPTIWDEGDEACDYLVEYFEQLKTFVREAAEARDALIVYIN